MIRTFKVVVFCFLFPWILLAGEPVQTPEDIDRLRFFTSLLDQTQQKDKPQGKIPQVLHWIWLGPKPFPQESIAKLKGWIDHHPDWTVKFWTDLAPSAHDDRMQIQRFDQFPLGELKDLYYLCDNFGERSQILRYAILLSEGGIYVDHDMICIQALDSLQQNYDFFCGLEPIGPTILSSSVNPSPHLLAATPQHPILESATAWLMNQWHRLEMQYPGSDPSSILNRAVHRSFYALSAGIESASTLSERKDAVFPPHYFSLPKGKDAVFALHQHCGSWYIKEDVKDLKIQQLFASIKREHNQTYWLALALIVINLCMGAYWLRRERRT